MKRVFYLVLGAVSLGLGVAGIFLPLLPTTPFLLLTAALWCRSSPKLYQRLLASKHLGAYIRNFRDNRAIPLRAKVVSVTLVWVSISASAFLAVDTWWVRALLLGVAIAVTAHILWFKTLPPSS